MKLSEINHKINELQEMQKEGNKMVKKIHSLLLKISPKQKLKFDKIFKDISDLEYSEIKHALYLLEKTILKNKETKKELLKKLGKYKDEFFIQYTEAQNHIYDFNKQINQFLDNKQLEEQKEKDRIAFEKEMNKLAKLPKVPEELQKGFNSFANLRDAEEYYKNNGYELYQNGEEYLEEVATEFCFVDNSFFEINVHAEILSRKQDVGDRYFWVDQIKEVHSKPFKFEKYLKIKQEEASKEAEKNQQEQLKIKNEEHEFKRLLLEVKKEKERLQNNNLEQ